MADVQLEHGYTRIANELMEALGRAGLSGRQYQVALVLLRMLYGYHKTEDRISSGQIAKLANLHPANVRHVLAELEAMGLIEIQSMGLRRAPLLRFRKDHARWTVAPRVRRGRAVAIDLESPTTPDLESPTTRVRAKRSSRPQLQAGVADDSRSGVVHDALQRNKDISKESARLPEQVGSADPIAAQTAELPDRAAAAQPIGDLAAQIEQRSAERRATERAEAAEAARGPNVVEITRRRARHARQAALIPTAEVLPTEPHAVAELVLREIRENTGAERRPDEGEAELWIEAELPTLRAWADSPANRGKGIRYGVQAFWRNYCQGPRAYRQQAQELKYREAIARFKAERGIRPPPDEAALGDVPRTVAGLH